jgi:LysM repeat protein
MSTRLIKILGLFTVVVFSTTTVLAAPRPNSASRQYYDENNAIALKELRDSVDDMRHESNNHELELKMLEEKIANQESIIDSLRQQMTNSNLAQKDLIKGNVSSTETKIEGLDKSIKGLVGDLRILKTHANDTAALLTQYTQRLSVLEKNLEIQNQNLDNMQIAIQSTMEALSIKDSSYTMDKGITTSTSGSKTYRVKPGDSLEKIAKASQTTISAIKELNGLSSDRIIVGQKLKLP